ncbi:hypothetical protein BH24GEM3_BH24GEM3_08800 [soil metagenome]|jgi:hypothetical protein|nr:hypothetical protein [Gemmatimonadota bacterium]
MATERITIEVDAEAARAYRAASAEERRKIQALVSLRIKDLTAVDSPLQEIMSQISRKAQERGLTPEILASLLEE